MIMKLREELETQLKPHDFASIEEFEDYIKRFEKAFEQESAGIIRDLLAKYDGRLYREGERYKNPQEVSALHGKLGGYRSNLDVMKQSEDVMQAEYAKQRDARERSRLPGHGGTTPEPTEAFKGAQKKSEGAKGSSEGWASAAGIGRASDPPKTTRRCRSTVASTRLHFTPQPRLRCRECCSASSHNARTPSRMRVQSSQVIVS